MYIMDKKIISFNSAVILSVFYRFKYDIICEKGIIQENPNIYIILNYKTYLEKNKPSTDNESIIYDNTLDAHDSDPILLMSTYG
jgi:hypothetical protein